MERPRPRQLTPYNASAFQLDDVVESYRHRTPYPSGVAAALASLMRPPRGTVLELGCGPGNITCALAEHAERIDAVDISAPMLALAQRRCPDAPVRWLHGPAETVELSGPYALAVAGDSLHWMVWPVVFPRIARALAPGAVLAIASAVQQPPPWHDALMRVIREYSVMQEFDSYDFIDEITARGHLAVRGRTRVGPERFTRTVDQNIDALHATAGLPRERMGADRAAEFDRRVRELIEPHARDGVLELYAQGDVVWGDPCPDEAAR